MAVLEVFYANQTSMSNFATLKDHLGYHSDHNQGLSSHLVNSIYAFLHNFNVLTFLPNPKDLGC